MARQAPNLMDELGAELLPDPEFRTVLTTHFPEGAQSDPKVVTYSRNGDTAIVARYKDGRLSTLRPGPALKPEDVEAVATTVRAEAAETRECVYRSIAFSIRRPAGYWRFLDRFQLLPAPSGAPDTDAQVAPHPLVLEFKVRRSANDAVSTMRWTDAETKLVLLLNVLLRFGLTHTGFQQHQRWVIETEWPAGRTRPASRRTIYASDGYLLPGFPGWADDFSDTSQLHEIPTLGIGEPHSADSAAPLEIPSYLAPGVACYYALTALDRDVFNRALYWFAHARAMYGVSSSAAFAALVQAIETLAGQPGSADPCPECKHDRSPGPTIRFKDFLTSVGVDRKTCDTFYKIRSDVLHGSRVLHGDIDGLFSTGLDPGSFEFYVNYDQCEQAARIAMLTWLWRQMADREPPVSDSRWSIWS